MSPYFPPSWWDRRLDHDESDDDEKLIGEGITEDTEEDIALAREVRQLNSLRSPHAFSRRLFVGGPSSEPVCDIDEEERQIEDIMLKENVIDLTLPERKGRSRKSEVGAVRCPPISHPLEPMDCVDHVLRDGRQIRLTKDVTIELERAGKEEFRYEYLRIEALFQNTQTQEKFVRGLPFARTCYMQGMLPRRMNEVCCLVRVQHQDDRDPMVQAAEDISISNPTRKILGTRNLVATSAPFPRDRADPNALGSHEEFRRKGSLRCRWIYMASFASVSRRQKNQAADFALIHLDESHPLLRKDRHRFPDLNRYYFWRDPSTQPGAQKDNGINLDELPDTQFNADIKVKLRHDPKREPKKQKYTMIDTFCGAGGASRGAERAGLDVILGIDHWHNACESYRLNFRGAKLYEMDIADYMRNFPCEENGITRADVLHLSPPCQFYSPAHTVNGPDDERNRDALFTCGKLVEAFRPRIFTLEQTFGIMQKRHIKYMNSEWHLERQDQTGSLLHMSRSSFWVSTQV